MSIQNPQFNTPLPAALKNPVGREGETLFGEVLSKVAWDEYAMDSETLVITLGRVRQTVSWDGERTAAVGQRIGATVQTDIAFLNTPVGTTGIRPRPALGVLVQAPEGAGLVTLKSTSMGAANQADTWASQIAGLLEWQYYWFRRVALPNEDGDVRLALQDPGIGWDGGARADKSLGRIQSHLADTQPAFEVVELLQRVGRGVGLAKGYVTDFSATKVDIRLAIADTLAEFSVSIEPVNGWGTGLLLRHTMPLDGSSISAETLNDSEIAGESGCAVGGAWTADADRLVFEQWLPLAGLTEDWASDHILNGIARLVWAHRLIKESPRGTSGKDPASPIAVRLASAIQPTADAGNLVELLGVDFEKFGLLGNATAGRQFWQWVRDERLQDPRDLWQAAKWCGDLLGIGVEPIDLPRWTSLGFAQGAYCGTTGIELPENGGHTDSLPSTLLACIDSLRFEATGSTLITVREALRTWIRNAASALTPEDAWRLGIRLGAAKVREGCLVTGVLVVQVLGGELEQRFALGQITAAIRRPSSNPWYDFVVSTYDKRTSEAIAVGASFEASLDRARRDRSTLGQFLLSGCAVGLCLEVENADTARAVLACTEASARQAVARMYAEDGVDTRDGCSPEALLAASVRYVHRSHGLLLSSQLTGCAAVVVRHAYDYLWWHGFLRGIGLPQ